MIKNKYFKNLLLLLVVSSIMLLLAACGSDSSGDIESSEEKDEKQETSFPEETIELVVPFDAGGGTDTTARSLAENVEKHMDESLAVLNVTGGGGAVGMSEVANSQPDGYKLGMATVELTTLPPLGLADFTYEDFIPVAQINLDPAAITVRSDSRWDTIEEFIKYAKDNPGEIKVGNSGTGAIWHLAGVLIEEETGVEFNHIPYEGAAPAVTALLSGEVDAVGVSPGEVLTQVEAGELETLAIASDKREDAVPDVPTMDESGIGNIVTGTWRGIVAPSNTDPEVISILEEAFKEGAGEKDFEEFMKNNGFGLKVTGSDEFKSLIEENADNWQEIIDDLGLAE